MADRTEQIVLDDGRRLAVRWRGAGELLVCHPGGPGFPADTYFGDLADLHEHRRLLLVDPRGTGGSDPPADPSAYDTDDYVADLEAVRLHVGVDRLDLLGHSHGGVVAQAYAAVHPERVRRLVVANSLARFGPEHEATMMEAVAGRSDEPWYEQALRALEAEQAGEFEDDEDLRDLLAGELPFYFATVDETARRWMEEVRRGDLCVDALGYFNEEVLPSFDLRPRLSRIGAPTLVLAADGDFITGPEIAREIAHAIPDATLHVIEDCGHFAYVERPEAFREAVLGFLEA